jgi:putative acetyltransferase
MTVRDTTRADAEAVRTVQYASIIGLGPEEYSQRQVEAWARGCGEADYTEVIDADTQDHIVVDRNGVVVGFGCINWKPADTYEADIGAEITAVYVLPSVARDGVGTEIYTELEQRACTRGMATIGLSASLPAVPFYESHGYERVTEHDHEFSPHVGTGVTGIVVEMRKEL